MRRGCRCERIFPRLKGTVSSALSGVFQQRQVGKQMNLGPRGKGLGLWVLREHCKGLSGRRKCYVGDDSWKQQKERRGRLVREGANMGASMSSDYCEHLGPNLCWGHLEYRIEKSSEWFHMYIKGSDKSQKRHLLNGFQMSLDILFIHSSLLDTFFEASIVPLPSLASLFSGRMNSSLKCTDFPWLRHPQASPGTAHGLHSTQARVGALSTAL